MSSNNISSFFKSTLGKTLIGFIALAVIVVQLVPRLVSVQPYADQVVAHIKAATGAQVSLTGGAALTMLPSPTLMLYGLKISNPEVERSPVVQVARLDIGVNMLSALSGSPTPKSVTLWNPEANFEKNADGTIVWGYLGPSLFKNLKANAADMDFTLQSGRVSFANKQTGDVLDMNAISASGTWAEKSGLKGTLNYNGAPMQFSASREGRTGNTPFAVNFAQGSENNFSLQGNVDFTAEEPNAAGKLSMSAANISPLMLGDQGKDITLPLKLSADYSQKEDTLQLSNMELESGKSKAKGEFRWNRGDSKAQRLTLDFATLDVTQFLPLLIPEKKEKNSKPEPSRLEKLLSDKVRSVQMDVKAAEVIRGEQVWTAANFNGELNEGTVVVNQFSIGLPGGSKIALFGLISQTDVQGVRFEGNCEASGASLKQLLTVFDESASGLPEMGFGEFNIRSNLFISKELLRLSEADMKFSEIALKGGLVAYFDTKPRIEANVRLRNINFDYVRDSWREKARKDAASNDYFLRLNEQFNYDWLKRLATSIDFKVEVDGFTFLERKGTAASFRIFAQSGEFGIYNAKFNFNPDITEANLIIDVKGEKPNVNLMLNTDTLSSDYFAVVPSSTPPPEPAPVTTAPAPDMPAMTAPAAPAPVVPAATDGAAEPAPLLDKVISTTPQSLIISDAQGQTPATTAPAASNQGGWSEKLLDMSWIESINGTFDISIGKLTHQSRLFQNFKMFAKLERNLLTFQTLTFAHWGGSFSINGTIFGGQVPGMSMGFVIASADLRQMLKNMLGVNDIGGKVSVSGTIETSGVNLLSWVSQANAQMVFAGRGVSIQGLDVASVITAVTASRTAADTFNNVNLSLVNGTGEYSADGTINVQRGVVSTAGIGMKTGKILGNVKGDLKLIPWTISMSSLFQFPELSTDTVPTLTLKWDGPLAKPVFQVDTQSLEAFVSKRITGN